MSSRQNHKKHWNIDTLLSVLGFMFELMRVVVNALRKRDGDIDHLRRLLKEPQLVDKVFNLIVYSPIRNVLRAGEYLVPVTYDALPSMDILEHLFSKNGVTKLLDGNYRWEQHESRKDFNEVPGDKVFLVKQFTSEEIEEIGGLESENIIAWGLKNGCVSADKKEAYAFGINPETRGIQFQSCIVALGSSTLYADHRRVVLLSGDPGGRILKCSRFDRVWDPDSRFLFVRK